MSHIDLIDRRRRAARLRIAELIALRKASQRKDAEVNGRSPRPG
ncbi:MAG: hypothetical protein ACRDO8_07420 [Nocardioidaceae bacterium]